jgi:hypothetical protein
MAMANGYYGILMMMTDYMYLTFIMQRLFGFGFGLD